LWNPVLGILDEAGRGDFDDGWLCQSLEHMNSYRKIAAIWNERPSLEPRKRSADALIQHTIGADDANVVRLPSATVPAAGHWGRIMGTLQ
jgi:hypothetical protein